MFKWLRERKQKKVAIRYIRESNAEIERVWRELAQVMVDAALMAKANKEKE